MHVNFDDSYGKSVLTFVATESFKNYSNLLHIEDLSGLSEKYKTKLISKLCNSNDAEEFFNDHYNSFRKRDKETDNMDFVLHLIITDFFVPMVQLVLDQDSDDLNYFFLIYGILNSSIWEIEHLKIMLEHNDSLKDPSDNSSLTFRRFLNTVKQMNVDYIRCCKHNDTLTANFGQSSSDKEDCPKCKMKVILRSNDNPKTDYTQKLIRYFVSSEAYIQEGKNVTLGDFFKLDDFAFGVARALDKKRSMSVALEAFWYGNNWDTFDFLQLLKMDVIELKRFVMISDAFSSILSIEPTYGTFRKHHLTIEESHEFILRYENFDSFTQDFSIAIGQAKKPMGNSKINRDIERKVVLYYALFILMNHSLKDMVEFLETFAQDRELFYDENRVLEIIEYFNQESPTMSLLMWVNLSDVSNYDETEDNVQ